MKDLLKVLLAVGIFGLTFLGSCAMLTTRATENRKIITDQIPSDRPFYVVVVTPDDAQVVSAKPDELDEYLSKHPSYSYLISRDQLDRVNRQIDQQYRQSGSKGYPSVDIEPLSSGRQRIHLMIGGDPHSEEYWYDANDKAFVPHAYRFLGALQDIWILPVSVLIAVVVPLFIFFFGRSAIRFILEMRRVT